MDEDTFCGWTIYWHPLDYPQHFAVRMWWVTDVGVVAHHLYACLCDSLDEAREQIPNGTIRFPRDPDDDAVIVETWM
jgi:hypothetical protein